MTDEPRVVIGELVGRVTVPEAPPLDLRPTSNRAIVTVVRGDEAERCHAVSGPYLEAYAKRLRADYVVLRWPGHPDWPMSAKFGTWRVLDHYSRMAYFDADVMVPKNATDIFRQCRLDEFGACDELPFLMAKPGNLRIPHFVQFRKDLGFDPIDYPPWHFNLGVMVVPQCYQSLLKPPVEPIWPAHCVEEDWINAKLLDCRARVRTLDRWCNWQNWTDPGFRRAPDGAILHWSGAGEGRKDRVAQMARWAETHPLGGE